MGHNHPPKQSAEAPAQFELSADDINPQLAEVWGTADTAEQRLAEKCQHGQMFITSTTGYGALAAEAVIQLAD